MDITSAKRNQALQILGGADITLSTQVINEVCCNLLRKASYTKSEIQQTVINFQTLYRILPITAEIIRQASVLRDTYSLSYWDSLICATAADGHCSILYSEDMQNGLHIDNLTIINPFLIQP